MRTLHTDAATPAALAAAPALLPAHTVMGALPGLVAAFSTALPRGEDAELAPLVRAAAQRQWGDAARPWPTPLLLRQTHSPVVLHWNAGPHRADLAKEGTADGAADGAAAVAGAACLLAVKTADCVPILAVDPRLGRYAVLHAGWRGTAAGILDTLLNAWRAAGSDFAELRLELGPHIQGCCYEVQADCLARFDPAHLDGAVDEADGRTRLHLAAVLRHQARQAGIQPHQVHVSGHCTDCYREGGAAPYASYRRAMRSGRPFAGTNVALIGFRPGP